MKKIAFILFSLFLFGHIQASDCIDDEVEAIITLFTDDYASESSWEVISNFDGTVYASSGTLEDFTEYVDTLCLPAGNCMRFVMYDSYGDGICCAYGEGYFSVVLDGDLVSEGGDFGFEQAVDFSCPPGTVCTSTVPIGVGNHTAPFVDFWYSFTPEETGSYTITTCDMNTCDTKLWVYEQCEGIDFTAEEAGAMFYNDNTPECGLQAEIPAAVFEAGVEYIIRVGHTDEDCDGTIVNWQIFYNGPIEGCTDTLSCNYNPLAVIDDGSCLYWGDADCPDGPDLVIAQAPLVSSMFMDSYDVVSGYDECLVVEECLRGYGLRDIIRFTTRIENIGNTDYYIGTPAANPDQFDLANCHGHAHYKGYAEYLLFDEDGNEIPVGFKNGFCVMDISCWEGGPQYGCGNMGISAGCADIYGSGTACNWIDITDVDTGRYTFVARTNWDQSPDALGRHETDYTNNWSQVCLRLQEDELGNLSFVVIEEDCPVYVDCLGVPYGSAQPDCTGECNGMTIMGDLDGNGVQEMVDAMDYVSDIIAEDIFPTTCNDLNADGAVTVSDAALLASCMIYSEGHPHGSGGLHDHCSFPEGILNVFDTVVLSIEDINFEENYFDVGIYNPYNKVVAYQFNISGASIMSVENLYDEEVYPANIEYSLGGQTIIGISFEDSLIDKSSEVQPLCRVYFDNITESEICISEIVDIVNQDYDDVVTGLNNNCMLVETSTGIENHFNPLNVRVYPNPFSDRTTIDFYNPDLSEYSLEITDLNGRILRLYEGLRTERIELDRGDLTNGVYLYRLLGKELYSGSFIIH